MTQFVVLGAVVDPHVERVTRELSLLGVEWRTLDFRASTSFRLSQARNGEVTLEIEGEQIDRSVVFWDRVKIIPGTSDLYFDGDPRSVGLRASEWRAAYRLIAWLYADRIFNFPDSARYNLKPYQQRIAAAVGFQVPLTLVTNAKSAVSDFVESRAAIAKSLSKSQVTSASPEGRPYSILTLAVSKEQVGVASEEQFSGCPIFIQENISKLHELRVVVVGNRVFAFKIFSQEHSLTKVDWRQLSKLNRMEPTDLDRGLTLRIMKFMKAAGLFTGSVDLIVDTHGEIWFLEVNPDGQWAPFDTLVDGAVAKAFASEFKEKIGQSSGGTSTVARTVSRGLKRIQQRDLQTG